MPILNYQLGIPGLNGVIPETIYIQTTDTIAEIKAPGYLNGLLQQAVPLSPSMLANVSSLDAGVTSSSVYSLSFGAGNVITLEPLAAAGGGSVTSVAAGTGLTAAPSPITGAGTLSITPVGAAGTTNFVNAVTTNTTGQITALTAYANTPHLNLTSAGGSIAITGPTTAAPAIDVAVQGGVAPAAYTNANITVNSRGIITAVANGSSGSSPLLAATLAVTGSTNITALGGTPVVLFTPPAGQYAFIQSYTSAFSGTPFNAGSGMRLSVNYTDGTSILIGSSQFFTDSPVDIETVTHSGANQLYSSALVNGTPIKLSLVAGPATGGDGTSHFTITVYYSLAPAT